MPKAWFDLKPPVECLQDMHGNKKDAPKHTALAPHDIPGIQWLKAHINLIGPWEHESNGPKMKVCAVTFVDPVTNLVEIACFTLTKSGKNASAFKNTWLSQHP